MTKILSYLKQLLSPEKRGVLITILAIAGLLIFIFLPAAQTGNVQKNIIKVNESTSEPAEIGMDFVGKDLKTVGSSFGELLNTSQINQETKSQDYSAGRKYYPVKVVSDNSGLVKAVLEPLSRFQSGELEKLKAQYKLPEPDFELYVVGGYMTKVFAFLSQGIAYEASVIDGQVFTKIYFTPTDKQGFLNLFPSRYSETNTPGTH